MKLHFSAALLTGLALASCGGDKVRAKEWKYFEEKVAKYADKNDVGRYVGHAFQASKYDPDNRYSRPPTICIRIHNRRDGKEYSRIVVGQTSTDTYGEMMFAKAVEWNKRCKGEPATDSLDRPIEIRKEFEAK